MSTDGTTMKPPEGLKGDKVNAPSSQSSGSGPEVAIVSDWRRLHYKGNCLVVFIRLNIFCYNQLVLHKECGLVEATPEVIH